MVYYEIINLIKCFNSAIRCLHFCSYKYNNAAMRYLQFCTDAYNYRKKENENDK